MKITKRNIPYKLSLKYVGSVGKLASITQLTFICISGYEGYTKNNIEAILQFETNESFLYLGHSWNNFTSQ